MLGAIYSDQRCPVCGGIFKDDGKRGLFCPNHPEYEATRFKVIFQTLTKRFKSYELAQRFLTGLRFKMDEGQYDPRDYRLENRLSFANLATKWLRVKKLTVKHKSYKNLENYMYRAMESWGQRNIKEIGYADIEEFLLTQKIDEKDQLVSPKTRANMKSALSSFWTWLRRQRILAPQQIPEFPETNFELGLRRVVDKPTQETILSEIYRMTYHINPKIWLGIKWLSTYISIRPGELIKVKEEDFDLRTGYVTIPHPKEKKPKIVPLLEEDIEFIKMMPRGFPHMHFFRHVPGIKGCTAGQPFGNKYLYKWWKKACENLGIEGVDLYGGTRHSSARALRQMRTPEEIKRATMHSTNKAFERYFQIETEDLREIYRDTQRDKTDKKLTRISGPFQKPNPLKS